MYIERWIKNWKRKIRTLKTERNMNWCKRTIYESFYLKYVGVLIYFVTTIVFCHVLNVKSKHLRIYYYMCLCISIYCKHCAYDSCINITIRSSTIHKLPVTCSREPEKKRNRRNVNECIFNHNKWKISLWISRYVKFIHNLQPSLMRTL